jgi:hypothetical protein
VRGAAAVRGAVTEERAAWNSRGHALLSESDRPRLLRRPLDDVGAGSQKAPYLGVEISKAPV